MLVCIDGNMGSGKTLLMSIIGYWIENQEIPVHANYQLEGTKKITDPQQLIQIENGLICLDEFWITVDSRLWKNNIFWTRWILMSRKKSLLILYTTQHFGQVDIRIRNATDYIIFCEDMKDKKFYRYTLLSGNTKSIVRSWKLGYSEAEKFYDIYDTFEIIKPLYTQSEFKR